jgi:hypothetical protein
MHVSAKFSVFNMFGIPEYAGILRYLYKNHG